MRIKEAVYEEVQVTKRRLVEDEKYGCDHCGKEITRNKCLTVDVFHLEKETDSLDFCSWECTLNHLPSVKSSHFITLPYLYFDAEGEDERKVDGNSFIELLQKLGLTKTK